ncbi:MAG: hypothetical protein WDM91_09280 [Rhizomicrobium sp.]
MFKLGVFLEYLGGGILALLLLSTIGLLLTGGSFEHVKEPDRTMMSVSVFLGPALLFAGWAMKKASLTEPPRQKD